MVRWGLGICAAVFAVMLMIPVPLRPDAQARADAAPQPTEQGQQGLSPVAAPRAGTALMSLPDQAPAEAPVPAMPEVASVATTSAPAIPSADLPEPTVDRTLLVPALAVRPAMARPEVFRVTAHRADLHAGPSALERTTSRLANGDRVAVLSRYGDRWVYVRLADGTTEGYLDATLLSPAD